MRYLWQILFHIAVTAAGVLMIVFGIQNDNTSLWVWGIIVLTLGNLSGFFLIYIIALLMIPAARHQDSATGMNQHSIANRVKYCKKCGKEVEYSIMICPNCGNKTYTEQKPAVIEEKNESNE